METTISITGQINGNFKLLHAIGEGEGKTTHPFNNGFDIKFKSKKDAVKAIRDAYKSLIKDEPECKDRIGGIRTNKDRTTLAYDASRAKINSNTH